MTDTFQIPGIAEFSFNGNGNIGKTKTTVLGTGSIKTFFGISIPIIFTVHGKLIYPENGGLCIRKTPISTYLRSYWLFEKSIIENDREFWSGRYILTNDWNKFLSSPSCKEIAINKIVKNKIRHIFITEEFTDNQRKWLRKIQDFLPIKDRFKITSYKGIVKIYFPDWWFTQGFYRIGWALLACRVANNRESMTQSLQKQFDKFRNRTILSNNIYHNWCGYNNWRCYFQ